MSEEAIRIIVADDHPIVRDGLVAILSTQPDFDVISQANNGRELIDRARQYRPRLILTDLEMPEVNGVQAIRHIHEEIPEIDFIVFTAFDTDENIVKAVQAGAKGYLLKGAPRDEVFKAIRIVNKGGSLLEPMIVSKLLNHISSQSDQTSDSLTERLTERETEVLQLLARGQKNREIAEVLFITERTVKFYVSAILGKLGARNRTEAVTIAAQRGLVTL